MAPRRELSELDKRHFQMFAQCAEMTGVGFWREVFRNAAQGKFPVNFGYKDGQLTFRHKKSIKKVVLPVDDLSLFCQMTNTFFRHNGLNSHEEQLQEWATQETDDNEYSTLTKIRSGKHRQALMEMFIPTLVRQYNLNLEETYQLQNTIHFGLILHAFPQIDLNEAGLISKIVGLHFDDTTRHFWFQLPKLKKKRVHTDLSRPIDEHFPPAKLCASTWDKFVKRATRNKESFHDKMMCRITSAAAATPILAEPIIPIL